MTEAEVVAMGWCPKVDCQCDAALHVKPNLPVGTDADVSPVSDDTPNERRARPLHCKCEAFRLQLLAPWVFIGDTVHTGLRCGLFTVATTSTLPPGPQVVVTWRDA